MIYDLGKPTKRMNTSASEIAQMIYEQNVELAKRDSEKNISPERAFIRESEEYNRVLNDLQKDRVSASKNKREFYSNLKSSLVAECLMKLYKDCCITPMLESDKTVVRNLINNFVLQEGAGELISRFKNGHFILTEFARICDKYYNKILEGNEKNCKECKSMPAEFGVQANVKDEFFEELEDVDTDDASKLIKDRVSDTITEFVDKNAIDKMEYEEIIRNAQDKMQTTKNEQYASLARGKIMESKARKDKSIFHCMVESLTTQVLKDEGLKNKFIHEASVDMDGIVNGIQIMYTMLEMVNTMGIVTINESVLNNYLESLNK